MKMFSIVMTEELKWLFSCQSVDRALIQFLSALLLVFAFWEMCSFVQRDSHTCWALPLWPRLMQGAVEDKWKWWRLRDSRWSWPSDRVAEGQSLMHPFFLSKWFFCPSVFFPEIQGANGGGPDEGCLEEGHICENGKNVGKEQNWILRETGKK